MVVLRMRWSNRMPKSRTPAQVVQSHLADAARTARLARSIIEQRLREIQQDLQKPGLPRHERGQLTLQVAELLQILNHGIDQSARSLLRPAPTQPAEPPTPAISADDVIAEITRGRTKSG
jgi:hypothetical protein